MLPALTILFCTLSMSLQARDLKDELWTIYKRSLEVKLNQDEEGYKSVFSKGRMDQFAAMMTSMKVNSFKEYMRRVAELEKRRPEKPSLVPQSVEQPGDSKAILKILAPKVADKVAVNKIV
jgi:hypothetical protein